MDARRVAEDTARAYYGRLVAFLAGYSRDVAAAEDALERWPRDGVPDWPESSLLTTARRRLADARRRGDTRRGNEAALHLLAEEAAEAPEADFTDERPKLLIICAHPATDAAARTPLML